MDGKVVSLVEVRNQIVSARPQSRYRKSVCSETAPTLKLGKASQRAGTETSNNLCQLSSPANLTTNAELVLGSSLVEHQFSG